MSIDLTGDLFANYEPPRRARRHDPETSHEAAEAVDRFASGHYALILEALRALGRAGAEQIAGRTRLDAYQIRKRLSELQHGGVVDVTGLTRITATGRRERIWVLL